MYIPGAVEVETDNMQIDIEATQSEYQEGSGINLDDRILN